ncbi:hypothetical protein [Parablautia sp. Marseille-Q6255]|uniref:hypothetical protein n=1 Tax=Parablautia sp. Marseille-Q6255 TaxID=3039593 RepID=UPI0024BCB410|nr:hypothetical protein [Parablautia sp. Marseille-Q6255]
MKVWKRVLIKTVIFFAAVAAAGAAAAGWRGYQQSTPEYTMEKYLTCLIDNSADKAYALLDQSEDTLTQKEYEQALAAGKYSLFSKYTLKELEKRRDNDGNEYVDYEVSFLDAADEVKTKEQFTVRKQAAAVLGIFDTWKVLAEHCMVKDFRITVPAGAQLYLNDQKADDNWLVTDEVPASVDCYEIPGMLPGDIRVTVRHPALESINTTLEVSEKGADYSSKMALKSSAKDACTELGVKALKKLYSAAAKEGKEEPDPLFDDCKKQAKKFAADQESSFHQEGSVFKNAAISDFAAQFGDIVFTGDQSGAITVEMKLSYHYVVRADVMEATGEVLEDGTAVEETLTEEESGDNTATFVLSFVDGEWKLSSMELPVIPENK